MQTIRKHLINMAGRNYTISIRAPSLAPHIPKIARNRNSLLPETTLLKIELNKAGYTATPFACGWAGAVFEVT